MERLQQFLVFSIDENKFALHIDSIERIIRAVEITPLPETHLHVIGVINIAGSIAPVFDLRSILGLSPKEIGPQNQLIIAKTPKSVVVLVMDTVLEVVELSPSKIFASGDVVPKSKFNSVNALAKIQDDIMLILNLEYFLALEAELTLEQIAAAALKSFFP